MRLFGGRGPPKKPPSPPLVSDAPGCSMTVGRSYTYIVFVFCVCVLQFVACAPFLALCFLLPRCFENEESKIHPLGWEVCPCEFQNELPEASLLGGPRWPPRRLLGTSWGALGASSRRLGSPGGHPETIRETILGATFTVQARGPRKSRIPRKY